MPYQLLYWGIAIMASTAAFSYMKSWQRFVWPIASFAVWAAFTLYVNGELHSRHRVGPEQLKDWCSIRDDEERRIGGNRGTG